MGFDINKYSLEGSALFPKIYSTTKLALNLKTILYSPTRITQIQWGN